MHSAPRQNACSVISTLVFRDGGVACSLGGCGGVACSLGGCGGEKLCLSVSFK